MPIVFFHRGVVKVIGVEMFCKLHGVASSGEHPQRSTVQTCIKDHHTTSSQNITRIQTPTTTLLHTWIHEGMVTCWLRRCAYYCPFILFFSLKIIVLYGFWYSYKTLSRVPRSDVRSMLALLNVCPKFMYVQRILSSLSHPPPTHFIIMLSSIITNHHHHPSYYLSRSDMTFSSVGLR